MSDILDKFTQTAGAMAEGAVKATSKLVNKGKEKADQVNLNTKLSKLYRQMGALVYSQRKTGQEDETMLAWYTAEIDKIKAELAVYDMPETDSVVDFAPKEAPEDAMFCDSDGQDISK